ncbi:LOW QUALITY PROTEIN: hypothetical protein ACHAXA_003799 [Cyclostephanos tholiformis]|uniref:DUF218 domain-containing protein n=1 Tax=Cyclostephanos tholiformis TaxID=382380 RepID=A0ABD3RWG7_9STRA
MRRAAQRGLMKDDKDDDYISPKGVPLARRRVVKRCKMRDGFKLGIGSIAVLFCLRPTIQSLFSSRRGGIVDGGHYLRGGAGSSPEECGSPLIHPDSQAFNENSVTSHATHLIIVAGHSVLISGNVHHAAFDDSVWYLYDYQKNKGLPRAIVLHIQAGIRLALDDPEQPPIFWETQPVQRRRGGSYFRVADALDLWDGRDVFLANDKNPDADASDSVVANSTVRARTVSEEYATDSFENMMFSICRFHEVTGRYPNKISLVSFTFKRRRFETLHADALRWPLDRFHYVGIDPPPSTGFDLAESTEGEKNNSLLPFQSVRLPFRDFCSISERSAILLTNCTVRTDVSRNETVAALVRSGINIEGKTAVGEIDFTLIEL